MMSLVLERLEQLQADLAIVDPANEAEAADAIAAIAGAVRKIMVDVQPYYVPGAETPYAAMQVAV